MKNSTIKTFFLYCFLVLSTAELFSQSADYEIESIQVRIDKPDKKRLKPPQAFFSIAWADIFGTNIPSSQLEALVNSYNAIGDKDLMTGIFLKSLIWGTNSASPQPWDIWLFGATDFVPANKVSEAPAELLFLIHRTLIAANNFNPVQGNEAFFLWMKKKAPSVQALTKISDENEFQIKAQSWSLDYTSEWIETQKLADSLLGIWTNVYKSNYKALRQMIIQDVEPIFTSSPSISGKVPELNIASDVFRSDPEKFIRAIYRNLLSREPDPYETWYLTRKVREEIDFSVEVLFYCIMSSVNINYFD